MIQEITIEKDKARYDANLKPHAHFLCNICKSVIDIEIDYEKYLNFNIELGDFILDSCHIYYYGICDKCIEESKPLLSIEVVK